MVASWLGYDYDHEKSIKQPKIDRCDTYSCMQTLLRKVFPGRIQHNEGEEAHLRDIGKKAI